MHGRAGREAVMLRHECGGPVLFDYSLDFENIDFRQHPELYRIGNP